MIIVLLGYMGSGKSSVGRPLANVLNAVFLDLDCYIEKQQQSSISNLFETKGAIEFRKIERKALFEICNSHSDLVLALGGGTPCYGDILPYLLSHSNVYTVYLKASLESLTTRLITEKSNRPLISNIPDEKLSDFIGKHLFERSAFYTQAQLTIEVSSMQIDQIVQEINSALN
tara:strand:+ start:357 stop:875 length:519 start_codon:yes stop_codon:yes gene_type:complete